MTKERYSGQVALLLQVLPIVSEQEVFALKGGTAINLFVRDMPRLSVDIDLAYLPIEGRDESLKGISKVLNTIGERVKDAIAGSRVQKVAGPTRGTVVGLIVTLGESVIKIEANFVLRGSVFACETRELCDSAQAEFSAYAEVKTLSIADLFGGKLCAVLDRQHPRDLFDAKLLLENEGITNEIRQAFVIYLASHSRPMHELLDPKFLDMRSVFESEFVGMSRIPVAYEDLDAARTSIVQKLHADLTSSERQFLLSVKEGKPQWNLIGIAGIEKLPGLLWKLHNIARMEKSKHQQQLEKLRKCLSL
ncbi:MAG: nucleotidyl transferase AbiEii/AbiGii toxin family protein [Oligoflexia bacterium]|nr:nucleotidyl transferase AbiEii/AbiGii toxin family protein [Oligoflexia bacterium]